RCGAVRGGGGARWGTAAACEAFDVAVAIAVVQQRAFTVVEAESAEERHALRPGRQVLGFGIEDGPGPESGNFQYRADRGHTRPPFRKVSWTYPAIARAASARNGAKLGQSFRSISTGRSGAGSATSP